MVRYRCMLHVYDTASCPLLLYAILLLSQTSLSSMKMHVLHLWLWSGWCGHIDSLVINVLEELELVIENIFHSFLLLLFY